MAIVIERVAVWRVAIIRGKGYPHQRIFQTFRFVNGDYLYQMAITFQPQLLIFSVLPGLVNLPGQPAHQRIATVKLRCRLLQ